MYTTFCVYLFINMPDHIIRIKTVVKFSVFILKQRLHQVAVDKWQCITQVSENNVKWLFIFLMHYNTDILSIRWNITSWYCAKGFHNVNFNYLIPFIFLSACNQIMASQRVEHSSRLFNFYINSERLQLPFECALYTYTYC